MPKLKTVYICQKCSYQSPRWAGQCYECKGWNTYVEDVIDDSVKDDQTFNTKALDITSL